MKQNIAQLEEIEITLRRSGRARRISLRVSGLDGQVTLTLPARVPAAQGLAFAQGRLDWLRGVLARQPKVCRVGLGSLLPIEGVQYQVQAGAKLSLTPEGLSVPGDRGQVPIRVAAYLKVLARDRLAAASTLYADRLGVRYSSLTLRDTRSRWGSCTAAGGLMYSWRLVMAPPAILDYVAAHEVAHLREMNHSPRFWQVVADLMPDYPERRAWLRQEGHRLHAYRFETAAE